MTNLFGVLLLATYPVLSATYAGAETRPCKSSIYEKYLSVGAQTSYLGDPTTAEMSTPDGRSSFQIFQYGSIYINPNGHCAWIVINAIREKWASFGWERGYLGYPRSDEMTMPDGVGRYAFFDGGSVYWHPDLGTHEIHGAIRDEYYQYGELIDYLGYPATDEMDVDNGRGRVSYFEHGAIYWTPATGAHAVSGLFLKRYMDEAGPRGWVGFPTTDDPFARNAQCPSGGGYRCQFFEHAVLKWHDVYGFFMLPR